MQIDCFLKNIELVMNGFGLVICFIYVKRGKGYGFGGYRK